MRDEIKYILAGTMAGAANGLFGGGGGMLLVPFLTRFMKMEEKKAFATSLAVILPMSVVSSIVYFSKGGVSFSQALPFVAGGMLGGIIGGRIFKKVSVKLLRVLLVIFMLYGGARLAFFG